MLVVFCVYWLLFQFNCYATKLTCALERSYPLLPSRIPNCYCSCAADRPHRVWAIGHSPRVGLLVPLSAALHYTIWPTDRPIGQIVRSAVLLHSRHAAMTRLVHFPFPRCARRCAAAQPRQCSAAFAFRYEKDTITVADYSLQVSVCSVSGSRRLHRLCDTAVSRSVRTEQYSVYRRTAASSRSPNATQ